MSYSDTVYWARFLFERGLAVVYLVGYLVAARQFRPLAGEHGLEPVSRFLRYVPFREAPSLFYLHYSDRFFGWIAWSGVALSALEISGFVDRGPVWLAMLAWLLLWIGYLSIVNIGQTFYGFGWESILIEAGFLAIFLGPGWMQAPLVTIFLIRWLLFRVEFGAGLIKLRADPCWRDLTCLDYHYETQPMPNPVSWFAYHLPRWFHHSSVLFNFFLQIIAPFGLFAPQPVATISAGLMIFGQLWLIFSGNYAWLNYLTLVLGFAGLGDSVVKTLLGVSTPPVAPIPPAFQLILIALAVGTAILSIQPILNMLSPNQRMNATYNPLHLVSSYGAFGSVTKERLEVVIEGTADAAMDPGAVWEEYLFKGKPGEPERTPPIIAPYHLRLDWQMWFLPFNPYQYPGWYLAFIRKLLENDPAVLKLLRRNPFPDAPPRYIRAEFYRYRYTSPEERRSRAAWWMREKVGEYMPPVQQSSIREAVVEDQV